MFNLLWQDVFVKVHEENLASHRHVAGKGILIAFPNYYFLFDTTPKKWFLTGGCSMESETTSTDFSYCYIKIQIRILHTLNGSFTQEWFCFIMYWSFEEYWLTNLCRSSKCSHISFCIMRKKNHIWCYHWSHFKSLNFRNYQAYSVGMNKFSEILIFAWNLKFYHL